MGNECIGHQKFTYEAWKNIKLSEVHFNTCLLTSSSKPQEFAVGTVFEKCPQKCGFRGRKIQIVYLIILWRIFQLSNFVRSNSWENYEGEDYILRLRRSRSRCRAGHCSHDSLPLLNSRVRSSKICYFMHFPYLLITRQQSSSSLCLGLVFYWDFLLFSSCRRPLQSSILK